MTHITSHCTRKFYSLRSKNSGEWSVIWQRHSMEHYLYRGVSVLDDNENNGRLLPKGENSSTPVYFGQQGACFRAGYTFGSSEGNAVRAHQVETSMNNGCYISTTRCKNVARKFATIDGLVDGYIYTLNPSLFSEYGVVSHTLPNSDDTGEYEVSIRAKDNGPIPIEVVINKELVKAI